ncbi:phosphotransferase family protein [Kutzneria albida]|uniref:Aminoglycoside phosphotransferase domain-containing protein n=1 Tax=Kutzneria albida DSM 43870 TaxID=1449976 RepID=W5WF04_9PSEU|nr:aminoglycoside phosphotransferase family protein [Kutzneria albida]AHH99345.1 hypothetical protein KALB_5985 [Kutzneria albida DSM 43870]
MDFRPVERAPGAFQQGVTAGQVEVMCARAFGAGTRVLAAQELGKGMYNNTYRVELAGQRPVILRVAPEPARQYRIERDLMRNEHASVPYLAPLAAMLPRTLTVDFTHELIGRDYLFQTLLDGVPAAGGLSAYPRPSWTGYFEQLGTLTRRLHSVRGKGFGPVMGPLHERWSDALLAYLADTAADLEQAGLAAGDVRQLAELVRRERAVLDEITEPRLLHGDLWIVNTMISGDAREPTITGVFDCDRTSWGDPESDWTIFMAQRRPGTERDAFWNTYGPLADSWSARRRALIYRARTLGAIRLERHRLGNTEGVEESYSDLWSVLTELATT